MYNAVDIILLYSGYFPGILLQYGELRCAVGEEIHSPKIFARIAGVISG